MLSLIIVVRTSVTMKMDPTMSPSDSGGTDAAANATSTGENRQPMPAADLPLSPPISPPLPETGHSTPTTEPKDTTPKASPDQSHSVRSPTSEESSSSDDVSKAGEPRQAFEGKCRKCAELLAKRESSSVRAFVKVARPEE